MRSSITGIALLLVFLFSGPARSQDSRNGYWFPPMDTIRVFVIYAELSGDPDENGGFMGWMPGELPPDPGYLFDYALPPGSEPRGVITKYFHQASFGEYVVLADHYPEIVTIPFSEASGRGYFQAIQKVFDSDSEDILTAHGYSVNRGDFDFISTSSHGRPKTFEPDSLIDIVMVIWRINSRITKDLSAGFVVPGKRMMPMKAMKGMNSYSSFVNKDYTRHTIIRHEYSHLLLGGNNMHTGGAGAGVKTFMSDVGGYAMLSSHLMSSPVYCSFDRRRLGWKPAENIYQISARDPESKQELDADLVYGEDFPNGTGEFILSDFVTTGDAIRIRLPYLQSVSQKVEPQWLWLENHQKLDGNIDHSGGTGRGLYAYIQVGKEELSGRNTYGGLCNYTWPVSAFGNWDFILDEENMESEIRPDRSNPLSGYNNLVYGVYDLGEKDGLIYRNEVFLSERVKINGSFPDDSNFNYETYPLFGTSFDAFSEGDKIGPDRNPTAASLLTYRTSSNARARPRPYVPSDNRIIHLNGLSVEFLKQLEDGSIHLRIRFDDTAIGRDVRWCGDIRLHENISLEKRIRLDLEQGLTPTRPMDPVPFKGQDIFADPTALTLAEGAGIVLQKKSVIRLAEGSSLNLEQGSNIQMERGSRIFVSDSSAVFLEPGARISGKGKIILQGGSVSDTGNGIIARIRSKK